MGKLITNVSIATQKKVSIVIRTYNEAFWLKYLLPALNNQNYKNFEIIVVDNESSDESINILKYYGIKKIFTIKRQDYSPGKSLNKGIKFASGEFIVLLSSHCIPYSNRWLTEFLNFIEADEDLAAVGGRQMPLPGSNAPNFIDLHNTFRDEPKIYNNDAYLSNANAIYRTEVLKKNRFDEDVTNIEDQIWIRNIIKKFGRKYKFGYANKSSVYHLHGIHQHKDESNRALGTVKTIIKNYEKKWNQNNFLKIKNNNFGLVINARHFKTRTQLKKAIDIFFKKKLISNYNISFTLLLTSIPFKTNKVDVIQNLPKKNLSENLSNFFQKNTRLTLLSNFSIYLSLANHINKKKLEKLIIKCCYESLQCATFANKNYSNFIINYPNGTSIKNFGLDLRSEKPLLTTFELGKGCVFRTDMLRTGNIINENIKTII